MLIPQSIVSVLGKKQCNNVVQCLYCENFCLSMTRRQTLLLRMETLVSISFLRPEFFMASSNGMDFPPFLAHSDVQSLVFGHEIP